MATYDKHYQEAHLFGDPYPEFVTFIKQWPHRGDALDLGCGQGRDALFLAAAGFRVTAVDISQLGVSQMMAEAAQRGLTVNGVVADFYASPPDRNFDLILFNAIFHFEKQDRQKEVNLLAQAASQLNPDGLLCLFIHKSERKEAIAKDFFRDTYPDWRVVVDRYIDYTYEEKSSNFKTQMEFNMFIVQNGNGG